MSAGALSEESAAPGEKLYNVACARCHGVDGADTSYPGIRRLDGIGKRLTNAEIRLRMKPLKTGEDEFLVRNYTMKGAELGALVEFVSRL